MIDKGMGRKLIEQITGLSRVWVSRLKNEYDMETKIL